MTRRKILLFLLFGILFFIAPVVRAQFVGHQTTCPVMPGTAVNEKFFADYQGKRIYFCCSACIRAFKKHPERYLKNLKE